MIAVLTRSAPSASAADARHERGVDPARKAEHDVPEAVLLDVVVQPSTSAAYTSASIGSISGASGPPGCGGSPTRASPAAGIRAAPRRATPRATDARRAAPAVARVAQPGCRRCLEVDVAHEQLLAELGRPRERRVRCGRCTTGVPVEDELVLAADEGAEGDAGDVVAGSLGEHPLALGALAGVVGGGRDVEDQRRAGERLLAGRWSRLPDVLAHGQPIRLPVELDDRAAGAGLEVALLVEDAVVGQVDLAVDRVDLAARPARRRSCRRPRPARGSRRRRRFPCVSPARPLAAQRGHR